MPTRRRLTVGVRKVKKDVVEEWSKLVGDMELKVLTKQSGSQESSVQTQRWRQSSGMD